MARFNLSAPLRPSRCGPFSALIAGLLLLTQPALATSAWDATINKAIPVGSALAVTPVSDARPMHIMVSLKLQNPDQLQATWNSLFTPGSPQYGRFLTPAQFAASFSPTVAQAQAVASYLTQQGFSHVTVSDNRVLVSGDAPASVVQKAFNTTLVQFQHEGKTLFLNTRDAQVPASLGGVVLGINGLENLLPIKTTLQQARERLTVPPYRRGAQPVDAAALQNLVKAKLGATQAGTVTMESSFPPTAWPIAYDALTVPDASGTTVAISTEGDDLTQVIKDLRQMERENKYPYVPVEVRITNPLANPQDTSGDGEWALDSQSSTGIAHNVHKLIFYTTDSTLDLLATYNTFAEKADAKVGNMSYGVCDLSEPITNMLGSNDPLPGLPDFALADQAFKQAAMEGLTWFASTGDDGGTCSPFNAEALPGAGGPEGANYPATSPYVTAVGGTSLFTDADFNYVTETAWTSGGGGISSRETAPAWQSGIVPSATAGLKGVPDIAMNAGFLLISQAGDTIVAGAHGGYLGTSLASPLAMGAWARIEAAHCNNLGFAASLIYGLDTAGGPASTATGFNDVITGSNVNYAATPGWDYTTGFGSIDVAKVNAALPAAPAGCTPVHAAPTAALTAAVNGGPAPLAVSFDGSGSTDPAGAALEYYIVDFGDGSDVAFYGTPAIPAHTYKTPGTYTASLSVRNAFGVPSQKSATQVITVTGQPLACVPPGEQLIVSPPGVSGVQGMDVGQGTDDLLATYFAEPTTLTNKLVVTMKVANLSNVLPGFRWVTYFNIPENSNYYYLSMDTANSTTPTFTYGIKGALPGPEPVSTYNPLGSLDSTSTYKADGTITLVLDESKLPFKAGDVLTNIVSSTRTASPSEPTGTAPGGVGLTQDTGGASQNYTVLGVAGCTINLPSGGGGTGTGGTGTGGTGTGTSTGTTTTTVATGNNSGHGRFGGGAFGLGLLPLLLAARRRRFGG